MHTWQDSSRRPWDLVITINSARRVWDRLKVNLRSYQDLGRLESDEATFLLPQLLAVLLEDRTELVWPEAGRDPARSKHNVLVERFSDLLEDAKIEQAALAALCEEIADFCQRRGLPPAMWATARTIPERLQAREETRAKLLDTPENQLKAIRGTTAGSPPASSGVSTSVSSPSDSLPTPSKPDAPPSGSA